MQEEKKETPMLPLSINIIWKYDEIIFPKNIKARITLPDSKRIHKSEQSDQSPSTDLIAEYSLYHQDNPSQSKWFYKEFQLKSSKFPEKLYVVMYHEDDGGGKWHNEILFFMYETMEEVEEKCRIIFTDEHNRNNECEFCGPEDCVSQECVDTMWKKFLEKKFIEIECTGHDFCGLQLGEILVKK